MQVAHVALCELRPGTTDEAIRQAADDLARIYRAQDGFAACALIQIADDTLIVLSVWDLAAQAEAAAQATVAWREQKGHALVGRMEQRSGRVAFWWDLAPLGTRLTRSSSAE